MPDGDIVHSGLRRLYQKPYKWLCEGVADSDECARVLLEKLKRDIKGKGDLPILLAQEMADRILQVMSSADSHRESDFANLSIEFENLVQHTNGQHRLKELILRAGKSVLNDLRNKRAVNISHISEVISRRYMHEVYESEFQERIPLTLKHYANVTKETLEQRIQAMQPNINAGIHKFAQDAIKDQSVDKISLPRRSSRKAIDLEENLLAS